MDDTKTQPEKSKSLRLSRPFAIDFVVSVQLEECIQRAQKYTGDPQLRVMVRQFGERNQVQFDFDSRLHGRLFIVGRGTMQRWQGTSTRIVIPIVINHVDIGYRTNQARFPIAIFALISTIVLYILLANLNFAESIRLQLTCLWLFGFCLLSMPILIAIYATVRFRQRRKLVRQLRHLLKAAS